MSSATLFDAVVTPQVQARRSSSDAFGCRAITTL
jgi:hypothetical protein